MAVLGRQGDAAGLETFATVVRDGRGRYFAGPNDVDGRINVYEASGRFLRTLGRPGAGPGEFQRISSLAVSPGDSLFVFDVGNVRLTAFTPELRLARTVTVPGEVHHALPRPDGGVIVQTHLASHDLAGFTVHRLDPAGRFLRSFGEVRGGYRPGDWTIGLRPLAPGAGGTLWLAYGTRYEIEQWSLDGGLRRTLSREARWFQPWSGTDTRDPRTQRPPPAISSIHQDAAGRLWVSLRVADARWRPVPRPSRGEGGLIGPAEADRLFDSLIEVIDPAIGRVVARARNPGAPVSFLGGDLAYRRIAHPDGTLGAEILRVRLVQP
ncbi:MAG TPA: hypothetical protein VFQ39_06335 [Longimicrobium sp.]|nr:hypothetical protein [Longimicrobium sp.]